MDEAIFERFVIVEKDVDTIKHDLYSNGQKGFIEETKEYIYQQRGMWKLVIAIGIILGVMEGISTVRSLMRPLSQPIPVIHQQQSSEY